MKVSYALKKRVENEKRAKCRVEGCKTPYDGLTFLTIHGEPWAICCNDIDVVERLFAKAAESNPSFGLKRGGE